MRYSIQKATVGQVKAVGGSDIKEAKSIGIIFADLSKEQANQLKSQGCIVTLVGEVRVGVFPPVVSPPIPIAAVPTYTPEQLTWAARIDEMRMITEPPLFGEGIVVAIIGTGIRSTHQRLQGRVVYEKNYTTDIMRDGLGHDTCVADIIVTVAPKCGILNLKVLDEKGQGTEEAVTLAIDDCISFGETNPDIAPTVINLSLGNPDDNNPNNPLRVACRAAIEKGIFIFASAGNSGPTPYSVTCPACEKYVFACGSCKYLPEESSFVVSDFSSRGPTLGGLIKPDAVLFGENIQLASNKSDTATIAKSGTSFAAPFAAAMTIIYLDGAKRQAMFKEAMLGLPAAPMYYVSPNRLMDDFLPLVSIKPQGVPLGKDNDYGNGFPYGPLAHKLFIAKPVALDISTIMQPVMSIVMLTILGMIIAPATKAKNDRIFME